MLIKIIFLFSFFLKKRLSFLPPNPQVAQAGHQRRFFVCKVLSALLAELRQARGHDPETFSDSKRISLGRYCCHRHGPLPLRLG